jgi:hypothetical protein
MILNILAQSQRSAAAPKPASESFHRYRNRIMHASYVTLLLMPIFTPTKSTGARKKIIGTIARVACPRSFVEKVTSQTSYLDISISHCDLHLKLLDFSVSGAFRPIF